MAPKAPAFGIPVCAFCTRPAEVPSITFHFLPSKILTETSSTPSRLTELKDVETLKRGRSDGWWMWRRPQSSRRKSGFTERNRWLKAIIVFASAKYQKRLLVSLSLIRLILRDGFFSRCQTRGGRTVNHLALWFQ